MLRPFTWLASFALHAAFAAYMLVTPGASALMEGTGEDDFVIEAGIAIEGASLYGQDDKTIEAIEAEPLEMSEARPEIQEVKATEEVEEDKVISSEQGPEQDELPEVKPEPVEVPVQQQVATVEQTEQIAVEEKRAAGATQTGGTSNEHSKYLGQLRTHLEKRKVNPRSRNAGTVVVRFTVDGTGNVINREVTRSSGNKILDDAAIASIDRAAPFPTMPQNVASGPLVVSVPFRFTVR